MINPEWTLFQPDQTDWWFFLELASREGWQVPPQEVSLYRQNFRGRAWVAKRFGRPVGFVTAVEYQRTGWIGNLLVAPEFRGRGMGGRLFEFALDTLENKNLEEIWLTASAAGRKIYRGRGFRRTDGIVRWVGIGGGTGPTSPGGSEGDLDSLIRADSRHWRDRRQPLLEKFAGLARIFQIGGTVAMLQGGDRLQVLGPWYSPDLCPRENRLVLAAAIESARGDIVLDVLESSPVNQLLAAAGFQREGRTDLMARSEGRPDLRGIVALASLGSIG